jgi:hypothetical protein
MDIYFILWVIIQCYLILLSKLFYLWLLNALQTQAYDCVHVCFLLKYFFGLCV